MPKGKPWTKEQGHGKSCEKKDCFFLLKSYQAFARMARQVSQDSIRGAESFASRDVILRALAAESYGQAKRLKKSNQKLSLQYMKLTAKLLGMSLRPKKLSDLDEIKKALAKLKAQKKGPDYVG